MIASLFIQIILASTSRSTKIAFGSCSGEFDLENPEIFKTIDALEPDAFVWLGDVVYADQLGGLGYQPTDPEIWRQKFIDMKAKDGYLQLRTNRRVLGIWDDHDYGMDNGNKHNPYKEFARQVFLEFIDEEPNSPRWTRRGGIYEAYTIEATYGSKRSVKLILLDVRFSADEWRDDGDSLGEEQWEWLAYQLTTPGDLTLICSGIQVMAEDRFGLTDRLHTLSRERLYGLIEGIPNVMLLTGDVHMSEIMLNPCLHYPVYEVTSSGLTHTVYTTFGFFHLIITHMFMPYTYNIGHRVTVKNFALITIDWGLESSNVTLEILDSQGTVQLFHSFDLSSLSKPASPTWVCTASPVQRYALHAVVSTLVYIAPLLMLGVGVRRWNAAKQAHR